MMDNEAGNKRSVGASVTNPIEGLAARLTAMSNTLTEINSRLTATAEHLLGPVEYLERSAEVQSTGGGGGGSVGNLHRIVDSLCDEVSRFAFTTEYLSQLSE